MNLDERLRTSYADVLDRVDLTHGDLAAARRTGARMRVRRRAASAGFAALAVLAVATGGALRGTGDSQIAPADGTGAWRELPAAPLSPRTESLVVWSGHELLVMGGVGPCPAAADDCPGAPLGDDAAYDPSTGEWRKLAPLPHPVMDGQSAVVADGQVVVATNAGEWYDYDLANDSWSTIATSWRPGGEMDPFTLTADGNRIYTFVSGRVHVYDVRTGRFSTVPADPTMPPLVETMTTATSSGLVVTGRSSEPESVTVPNVVLGEVWDGTSWRRLPPTGQVSNEDGWRWTGTHMIDTDTYLNSGDNARSRWGHAYPEGGIVDPAAGTWSPLPDRLTSAVGEDCPDLRVSSAPSTWSVACDVAYDDVTGEVYGLDLLPDIPTFGVGAAWAGDRLIAFGGALRPPSGAAWATGLSNRAWLWAP